MFTMVNPKFAQVFEDITYKNSTNLSVNPANILEELLRDFIDKKTKEGIVESEEIITAKKLLSLLRPLIFPNYLNRKGVVNLTLFEKRKSDCSLVYFIKHLNERSHRIVANSDLCQLLGAFFCYYEMSRFKLNDDLRKKLPQTDIWLDCIIRNVEYVFDNAYKDQRLNIELLRVLLSLRDWLPTVMHDKVAEFHIMLLNTVKAKELWDYREMQCAILRNIKELREWVPENQRDAMIDAIVKLLDCKDDETKLEACHTLTILRHWLSAGKASYIICKQLDLMCDKDHLVSYKAYGTESNLKAYGTVSNLISIVPAALRKNVLNHLFICAKETNIHGRYWAIHGLGAAYALVPVEEDNNIIDLFNSILSNPPEHLDILSEKVMQSVLLCKHMFIRSKRYLDLSALELKEHVYPRLNMKVVALLPELADIITPDMRTQVIRLLMQLITGKFTKNILPGDIIAAIRTLSSWHDYLDAERQNFCDLLASIIDNQNSCRLDKIAAINAQIQLPYASLERTQLAITQLIHIIENKSKHDVCMHEALKVVDSLIQMNKVDHALLFEALMRRLKFSPSVLQSLRKLCTKLPVAYWNRFKLEIYREVQGDAPDLSRYAVMLACFAHEEREHMASMMALRYSLHKELPYNELHDEMFICLQDASHPVKMVLLANLYEFCSNPSLSLTDFYMQPTKKGINLMSFYHHVYNAYRRDLSRLTLKSMQVGDNTKSLKDVLDNHLMKYRF